MCSLFLGLKRYSAHELNNSLHARQTAIFAPMALRSTESVSLQSVHVVNDINVVVGVLSSDCGRFGGDVDDDNDVFKGGVSR